MERGENLKRSLMRWCNKLSWYKYFTGVHCVMPCMHKIFCFHYSNFHSVFRHKLQRAPVIVLNNISLLPTTTFNCYAFFFLFENLSCGFEANCRHWDYQLCLKSHRRRDWFRWVVNPENPVVSAAEATWCGKNASNPFALGSRLSRTSSIRLNRMLRWTIHLERLFATSLYWQPDKTNE